MRVLFLTNAAAGKGASAEVVRDVSRGLHALGASVASVSVETLRDHPRGFRDALGAALDGVDVVLVAGGDGTVHHALPTLVETGVAVLHVAMGTENLFAREFGSHGARTDALVRRVLAGKTRQVDVLDIAHAGSRVCLGAVMASMGPDAGVIRRMDQVRRGPISHASYVVPVLRELRHPHLPRLRVEVDGRVVVDGQTGVLVVANSRQYALRADPAHRARVDDGLLDVAFLPARSALGAGLSLLRARSRIFRNGLHATGTGVRVRAWDDTGPVALQADGEHVALASLEELEIGVRPGVLRVVA